MSSNDGDLVEFVKSKSVASMFANNYDKALKNDDHKEIVRHFKSDILGSYSNCFDKNASERFGVLCHGKKFSVFSSSQNNEFN